MLIDFDAYIMRSLRLSGRIDDDARDYIFIGVRREFSTVRLLSRLIDDDAVTNLIMSTEITLAPYHEFYFRLLPGRHTVARPRADEYTLLTRCRRAFTGD